MARRSNGSIGILSSHFTTNIGLRLTEKDLQLVLNAIGTLIPGYRGVETHAGKTKYRAHIIVFYPFQKHYRITWRTFPVSFKQWSKWIVQTFWRNIHSNEIGITWWVTASIAIVYSHKTNVFAIRITLPGLAAVCPAVGGPRWVLCMQVIGLGQPENWNLYNFLSI